MEVRSFKSENTMINYNGKFINSNSNIIKFNNRGLNYGDGLFETIIYNNENIPLLSLHWERLSEGVSKLKIDIPFDADQLQNYLIELIEENELQKTRAKIKLLLWRAPGGLYTPESSEGHFQISAIKSGRKPFKQHKNVAIGKTVCLQGTDYSHLKTISALPYVLAGIEKKEREMDELVLTDKAGNIAEASDSNIFFYSVKNDVFFTPSLACGGINGVSRRFIMQEMENAGMQCKEVKMKFKDLTDDIAIFTTNVSGINQILSLDGLELNTGEKAFYILNNLFPFNH